MYESQLAPAPVNHAVIDPSLVPPTSRSDFMHQLHGESVLVHQGSSIYPPETIGIASVSKDSSGSLMKTSVAAEFALPDGSYACVLRHVGVGRQGEASFSIQALSVDKKSGRAWANAISPVGVPKDNDGLIIGRGTAGSRAIFGPNHSLGDDVSRGHLKVVDCGNSILRIEDTSTNGSKIAAQELHHSSPARKGESVFEDYTKNAEELQKIRNEAERLLGRKERHTIGRDSRLKEGVYEGKYGGEKIVVNYDDDPSLIDAAVDTVIEKCTVDGKFQKNYALDAVYQHVLSSMRYDKAAVNDIFMRPLKGRDGAKISLSHYIQEGVGVCRHQALYAGIILEQLADRGYMNGTVSVRRNAVKGEGSEKYDGHAWVRYTNSSGDVFILDVAQQVLGSLPELAEKHRKNPRSVWNYQT